MRTEPGTSAPEKKSPDVSVPPGGALSPASGQKPPRQGHSVSQATQKGAERGRLALSVVVTVAACALTYAHAVWSTKVLIDGATIALFLIAVLPWLAPFFRALRPYVKSAEIAGLGKVELLQEPQPSEGGRAPALGDEEAARKLNRTADNSGEALREGVIPADYYYINHSSRLKDEVQAEARAATGVDLPHYNIRVIVDSYYEGALDRVVRVDYILHRSYPEPYRVRYNRDGKFLLKEWANGEYVLMAKVFLHGRREPVLLQRYITLWKDGPQIP